MMLSVQTFWGEDLQSGGTEPDWALDCCLTLGQLQGFTGPRFPHLNYGGRGMTSAPTQPPSPPAIPNPQNQVQKAVFAQCP